MTVNALTKQERDGLEDIFLSIQTNSNKYVKIKEISSYLISKNISSNTIKFLKMAKIGLNESKILQFIKVFTKKKKFLSK